VYSIIKSPIGTTCESETLKVLDDAPSAKDPLKIVPISSYYILSPNGSGKK
jgi:hypothetical protein